MQIVYPGPDSSPTTVAGSPVGRTEPADTTKPDKVPGVAVPPRRATAAFMLNAFIA